MVGCEIGMLSSFPLACLNRRITNIPRFRKNLTTIMACLSANENPAEFCRNMQIIDRADFNILVLELPPIERLMKTLPDQRKDSNGATPPAV